MLNINQVQDYIYKLEFISSDLGEYKIEFIFNDGTILGGFLSSLILEQTGYIANHVQTYSALVGIKISFILVLAICFIIGEVIMLADCKFEKMEATVKSDLEEC